MMTLGLLILQYFDTALRAQLHFSSWLIVIVMDVLIIVGICQIVNPFPGTLGAILG